MDRLVRYGAGEHHLAEAAETPSLFLARVISQHKGLYTLGTEEGECLAEVSGRFRYGAGGLSSYPAVGDFVMADRAQGRFGHAIILRVLSRKSVFERAGAGRGHQTQVVAANIDTIFVCMSLNKDYNLSRLERILSAAWSSGATPVVVLTKSDLCEDLPAVLSEVISAAPGAEVVATSGRDPASCEKLLPWLRPGMTASFIGSSGVGKTTLINQLTGDGSLATREIRRDDKGRHTTTRRHLMVLPQGGMVIDTPGMREFGVDSVDLATSFSDIDDLAGSCRFRDCTHATEPGCAVRQALENGALDPRRLESYRKLQREARYDGLTFKQLEVCKLNTMFESVGGLKKARGVIRQSKKRSGR